MGVAGAGEMFSRFCSLYHFLMCLVAGAGNRFRVSADLSERMTVCLLIIYYTEMVGAVCMPHFCNPTYL
jgi:hypothetical protein